MNFLFWRTSDEPPSCPTPSSEEDGGITQEMKIALDGLEGPKQKMVELQKKLNGAKKSVPPVPDPPPASP